MRYGHLPADRSCVSRGRTAVIVGFAFYTCLFGVGAAGEQLPPASRRAEMVAARDAQFAELARDVACWEERNEILRKAALLVRPSVVHIVAEKTSPGRFADGGQQFVEEAGAGVIVRIGDKDYVLTNRHVIRDAVSDRIQVHLADGRLLHPTRMWSDCATDVAVLKVDAPGLVPARLGSHRQVDIGDLVLAFGSPFGLSHSLTHGIISAKGRRDLQVGSEEMRIQDFLQTDAAINPGNSGGPLLNLRGEVIGINTAIASNSGGNEGIGFSIPIKMAMLVADRLVQEGALARAYLGVQLDASFGLAEAADLGLPTCGGTRVAGVSPGSPAEEADIKSGDIIWTFDGVNVEDDSHLVNLVGLAEIGRQIELVVFRDGRPLTVFVIVREKKPARTR